MLSTPHFIKQYKLKFFGHTDFQINGIHRSCFIIHLNISLMNFKLCLAVLCLAFFSATSITLQSHFFDSATYFFNEKPLKGECTNDKQCDGKRTCKNAKCQGIARPAKTNTYAYTEGAGCPKGPNDAGFYVRDYFCSGNRKCSPMGKCFDPL